MTVSEFLGGRWPLALLILWLACAVPKVRAEECSCKCCPEQSPLEGVDLLLGAGLSLRFDDHIDWKESTRNSGKHLVIENDSRKRATGMIGLGIDLLPLRGENHLQVFASMNFTDNTAPVIDGFVFGGNVQLNKHVGVALGYGLRNQTELRHGFQRDARQFVRQNELERQFPLLDTSDAKYFDGLPLTDSEGVPYFAGSPLVDSFNHSLFIGLTFPMPMKRMLQD